MDRNEEEKIRQLLLLDILSVPDNRDEQFD